MPSTADSQSFVVQSTADSEASSHDDDRIGDLNLAAAGSLYPNKKMKKEEVEKEEEFDETKPCECCRKLETTKLEHMPGDEYYECNVEEYRDEHEMLRLIYYLRSVDESGGFYVECPPPGFFGGIYNRAHFPCMNFNEKAEISARRAINEYNEKKTKKLEFVRMINATGSPAGHYTIFYLTFEAVDTEMGLKNTYQAVVCYDLWQEAVDEVSVFRSESNEEDLLDRIVLLMR
ncbi:hypothetical protein LINGRAHAP2_LOCUS12177 [Linum grandiflorum]